MRVFVRVRCLVCFTLLAREVGCAKPGEPDCLTVVMSLLLAVACPNVITAPGLMGCLLGWVQDTGVYAPCTSVGCQVNDCVELADVLNRGNCEGVL